MPRLAESLELSPRDKLQELVQQCLVDRDKVVKRADALLSLAQDYVECECKLLSVLERADRCVDRQDRRELAKLTEKIRVLLTRLCEISREAKEPRTRACRSAAALEEGLRLLVEALPQEKQVKMGQDLIMRQLGDCV